MLNINTNYGAAFAAKAAKSTNSALNTSFERLSSGSRINFAKDEFFHSSTLSPIFAKTPFPKRFPA